MTEKLEQSVWIYETLKLGGLHDEDRAGKSCAAELYHECFLHHAFGDTGKQGIEREVANVVNYNLDEEERELLKKNHSLQESHEL